VSAWNTVGSFRDADADLADYLAVLQQELGREVSPGRLRRYEAVALWHVAKAGLMRDRISEGEMMLALGLTAAESASRLYSNAPVAHAGAVLTPKHRRCP